MKIKISLVLMLFIICNIGFSQIKSWKFIDVPMKLKPTLYYHSSDSLSFTRYGNSYDLFLGKNFNPTTKILSNRISKSKMIENDNYIFFNNAEAIYKYDKTNSSIIKIIDSRNFSSEYAVIGNFIYVGVYKSTGEWTGIWNLLKLDFEGNLVKEFLNSGYPKIILSDNINIFMYESSSSKLYVFDLNLSLKKSVKTTKFENLEMKGNLLFSKDSFSSDQGSTWQKINTSFDLSKSAIIENETQNLYRLRKDTIFFSTNNGSSFQFTKLPIEPTHAIVNRFDEIFIQNSNYCRTDNIFRKKLNQNNWIEIELTTNTASPFTFEAGKNENLLYFQCNALLHTKLGEEHLFEKFGNFGLDSYHHRSMLNLDDERFLICASNNLLISSDKGKSWASQFAFKSTYSLGMVRKKDVYFLINSDTITTSTDGFKTFQNYVIPNSVKWTLYDWTYYPTNSHNIFTFNKYYGLTHYNLKTGQSNFYKKDDHFNKLNFNFYDLQTSYDGNTLYLYASDTLSNHFILVTDDNFLTHNLKTIPVNGKIISDHLNNLYLYKDHFLFVSENKGDAWKEIGQNLPVGTIISDVQVSPDHYLYLATNKGILKSNEPINKPSTIEIALHFDTNKDCMYDNDELFTLADIKVKVNDSDFLTPNADGIIRYETQLEKNKIQFYYDTLDLSLCIADSLTMDVGVGLPETKRLDVGYNRLPKCPKLTASLEKLELKNCSANTLIFKICNNGRADAEDVLFESTLPYLFGHVEHVNDPFGSFNWWVKTKIPKLKVNECKNYIINYDIDCNTPIQDICITGKLTHKTLCGQSFELKHCAKNYTWNNDFTQRVIFNGKEINSNSSIAVNNSQPQLFTFENNMIYNGTDSLFSIQIEDEFSDFFDLNTITVLQNSLPYSLSTEDGKLLISMKGQTQNGRIHQFFYTIKTKNNIKSGDVLNIESFVNFDKDWHGYWRDYKFNVEISNATSEWDGDHFVIYPNPFESTLIINSQNQDDFSLKIYNTQGQVLYHQESITSGTALNLQEIPSQLLYIELTYKNNQRAYSKVVKY